MKNILILILIVLASSSAVYSQIEVTADEDIFMYAEEEPEFPGGQEAMADFIKKNLNYPALARENSITGKVFVEFIVDQTGAVSNVICKRGIGAGCDEEAIRVIKSMPKWKPGKQNGRAVKVRFVLPINFTIR